MTGGSVRFPPVVFLYDGATGRSSFLLLVFFLVPPRRGPSRDPIVILSVCVAGARVKKMWFVPSI